MKTMKKLETLYSTCPETGCWIWNAGKTPLGYGRISTGRAGDRSRLAHRHLYEVHKGDIPEGKVLDHLCRNRSCVNPDHLEAVTHKENVHRGVSPTVRAHLAGTCMTGLHKMTDDNVLTWRGNRKCKACALTRQAAWKKARRAEYAGSRVSH